MGARDARARIELHTDTDLGALDLLGEITGGGVYEPLLPHSCSGDMGSNLLNMVMVAMMALPFVLLGSAIVDLLHTRRLHRDRD